MVLPLWDDSIDSEENYIRSKISLETWATKSGASLFDELKEIGFSIGENQFYAIRRDILNLVRHQEQIENLRPDTLIPLGYMDKVPTWKMGSDYMNQVRITGTFEGSTETKEVWYTITSNKRYSKSEIQDLVNDEIRTEGRESDTLGMRVSSIDLSHVYTLRTEA